MVVAILFLLQNFSCFLDSMQFIKCTVLTISDLVDKYAMTSDPEVIFMDDASVNPTVRHGNAWKQQQQY